MAKRSAPRLSPVERDLEALKAVEATPETAEARSTISRLLAGSNAYAAGRAARLIAERHLEGFNPALRQTFSRLAHDPNPVKSDPSCHGKLGVLDALDLVEDSDPEPFLIGARCVQREPAFGGPVDTAAAVRVRGLLALGRLGWPDLNLLAAEGLADPEPQVRQGALEALAHHGGRGGAGLALFKMRAGDAEPGVILEAMTALMVLAPDWGLTELRPHLMGKDAERAEWAAVALGQSRQDAALSLLEEALSQAVLSRDRAIAIRGIGLHRSDRALELLLEVVSKGRAPDAAAAVEALLPRRFEPSVEARVRAAVGSRMEALVSEALSAWT